MKREKKRWVRWIIVEPDAFVVSLLLKWRNGLI